MRKLMFLTLSFLILLLSTNKGNTTKMLHRNAREMISLSERIFVGLCLSVEQKHLNLNNGSVMIYTEYTFKTLQSIKGVSSEKVVLRQVGVPEGPGSIIGMPTYKMGLQYLLFLREDSEYGFASPIGLGQGAFKIFKANNNDNFAVNAFGNRGLFHRMDSRKLAKELRNQEGIAMLNQGHGPVGLENFINLIKILAN